MARPKSLSQVLIREYEEALSTSTKEKATIDMVIEFMYGCRLFSAIFWFINLGALGTMVTICRTSVYAGWTWYYGLIAGAASAGWIVLILIPVGSCFSRIFR